MTIKIGKISAGVHVEGVKVSAWIGTPGEYHLEGPEIEEVTFDEAIQFFDDLIEVGLRLRRNLADKPHRLEAECERLKDWLQKIDGGDNPCLDQDQLRQWAHEALVYGREP